MPITTLTIDNDLLEIQLKQLNSTLLKDIKAISQNELPKLIFIAIDNDILHMVDFIKHQVLQKGGLPIIGESALGTHLVTTYYRKKEPILRDCLSLIDLCDEFWIVTAESSVQEEMIHKIPEGVLFEVRYWQMMHPTKEISVYNTDIASASLIEVFKLNTSYPLCAQDKSFNDEVKSALGRQIPKKLKSRFIATATRDAKHADNLRLSTLADQQVPVSPYNLINIGTLSIAFTKKLPESEIIKYYATIALKCQEIYAYAAVTPKQITLEKLDYHILFILFLTNKLKNLQKTTIHYKSFYEIDIPKFTEPDDWKITRKEANNVHKTASTLEPVHEKNFLFFTASSNAGNPLLPAKHSLPSKL